MSSIADPIFEARRAANAIAAGLGVEHDVDVAHRPLRLTGNAPRLDTHLKLAPAAAAVHAVTAEMVERRWRLSGGPAQQVEVDLTQAAASLFPSRFQRQWGHPVPIGIGVELKQDFYATADDRWFYPVGSYPRFRDATLALLDCPNTTDAIARSFRRRTALEWEEAFADQGLTGAMARTADEWHAHPQGRLLADSPVVRLEKIGEAPPAPPRRDLTRPLGDIRVLDLSHVIAGPIAARTLAEQGADVLRLSAPHQADPLLQIIDTGIGKRSAFLDLRDEGAPDQLRALASTADVFVESWRAGAMTRRGFGPEQLAATRPGLVYVSVSAYGDRGPWANRGGYEQVGQVVSGVSMLEGGDGRPRLVPTHFLADYLTGYLAAAGAAAGLLRRSTEGGSWHVTVSLTRTCMWALGLGVQPAPRDPIPFATLRPRLETRDSPFGRLEQMAPVATYDRTPSSWDRPPSPLGAHAAQW